MYVCMYVCMYVWMYVGMYVCMLALHVKLFAFIRTCVLLSLQKVQGVKV
jgi:hypothetical protein